ncbi:MAG: RecX family transcriptional regulator [Dysgonamonadaceae bacterium]|jgi:regulatory protein|nr:RecX family transcriptional regulator [Dysgonamonadaceae bacterium]
MAKITNEQAYLRLAAYCSRAERCIFDANRKMAAWEIEPQDRKTIIQKLEKEGFIDENRYCRAFVSDKMKFNGWGKHKIRYELLKRRIPSALIDATLADFEGEGNLTQLADMLSRKRKSIRNGDERIILQKLYAFGANRGFSFDEIKKALLLSEDES